MTAPNGESVPLAKVLPQTSVLYDVGARGVARVYAEALLKTAAQAGQADEVLEELISLVEDVCATQPEFESFLLDPTVGRDRKAAALNKALANKANPIFLSFLQVLNRHERLDILRPLVLEGRLLHLEMQGKQAITVRTAVPLPDDQRDKLIAQLRQTITREPMLVMIVDPDLIGGITVRVGDWLFDASVRTQLNNIRTQLFERSAHEIQTGRDRFRTD